MDTFAANLAHTQPTVFLAVPRIWEKLQEGILKKMPQKKLSRLLSIPGISWLIKKGIQKKTRIGTLQTCFYRSFPN